MNPPEERAQVARRWIARAFTLVEDVVYIGLALLLAASALVLLGDGFRRFGQALLEGSFDRSAVGLLDGILLVLLVVELLYTVQVSFREHALLPEPFLLVGLIAAIRRVLILTAQFKEKGEQTEEVFRHLIIELSVLTILILVLSASLVLVHRRRPVEAGRA